MKHFMYDRRVFIGVISIGALFCLGIVKNADVAMSIATIAGSIAAANAYERGTQAKAAQPGVVANEYRSENR